MGDAVRIYGTVEGKNMKTVEILGANRFDTYKKTREGSRAIIIQDGKILLTHELNSGWWLLPGGGVEEGENKAEKDQRQKHR